MHMEPTYAASLAKAVAAAAQGNIPSYAMTNDNIRLITGENGSTWRDFAYRNKDAIVTKANHK
jgi:dTDP-4-dehydrorhamnose reductase